MLPPLSVSPNKFRFFPNMDEDFELTEKAFNTDSPELLKNLPPKAKTHIENLAESSEINRKPLFEKGIELILFKMNRYGIYPMKLILIFLIPKLRSIDLTMLASYLLLTFMLSAMLFTESPKTNLITVKESTLSFSNTILYIKTTV